MILYFDTSAFVKLVIDADRTLARAARAEGLLVVEALVA